MSAGHIDAGLGDAATLAYPLMTTIIQGRIVWIHAHATPESRHVACAICRRHAEFFTKAALA